MQLDADLLVITLALGALVYGIYMKSVQSSAGYNETPPPQNSLKTLPLLLPGVPEAFLRACQDVVDSPGATLAGPVAPKGVEPDKLKDLVSTVISRMKLDIVCTAIDGGYCVADADGSEQHEMTCILYEKDSNVSLQVQMGMLVLDDGRLLVTKLAPKSRVEEDPLAVQENPWKLEPTPYSLPIDGV
jgi:hypothetical protein